MSKKGGDAPSADPNIGKAALLSAQTGEEWLGFAKDAFAKSTARQEGLDKLVSEVTNMQMGMAKEQFGWAKEDRGRYNKVFKPLEDKFIKTASEYGSEANQQVAAAEAAVDTQSATAQARETSRREMSSIGITPGSGRWAGVERAGELGSAATVAGAKNMARKDRRERGLALQADVVNLGRGLPAQAAQAASGGYAGSGNAGQLGIANQQVSMQPAQIMNAGYQGQMAGYGQQGSILNQQYGLELEKWRTQQEMNSAGWGGAGEFLGTIAGAAIPLLSDKKAKKNIKPIAKGKALEAVKGMPVKKFDYKEGRGDGGEGHVGTMAQDFKRESGMGDGKTINVGDALGLTMKAVQELNQKVDKLGKQLGVEGGGKPAQRRSSQSPARARGGVAIKGAYKPPPRPSQQLGLG
jgi:endosialidase-like protein